MSTWADPTATWADPVVTWTGGDGTTPEPPVEQPRRTNFLIGGWYFDQQEPFYEVVDWAEGRGEPFYVYVVVYYGAMRTMWKALAVAVLIVGLAGPAHADDPPIESGESTVIYGGNCSTNQNPPYASSNHAYLQSYFQVTCSVSSAYRIVRMHVDAKYGASPGGGAWAQYSNQVQEKAIGSSGTLGTITYNPLRDVCHWGSDWNYYRRTAVLEVTTQNLSTGHTVVDTITFYKQSPSRIPCGDHE